MNKLKPCPFCGGKAIFLKESTITCKSGQTMSLGVVACMKLCCEQHYVSPEKEAIEAWNRRAPEIVKVETSFYDKEEIHENCTVQVLTNTATGEVSVGWWQNDN